MTLLDKLTQARALSKATGAAKKLISERGDSNAASMASDVIQCYQQLGDEGKLAFYQALATNFNPDSASVVRAAHAYSAEGTAANLIKLTRVSEPPRQELLRRINRAPGGTRAIVAMRRDLLKRLDKRPELAGLRSAAPAEFMVQPGLPDDAPGRLEVSGANP